MYFTFSKYARKKDKEGQQPKAQQAPEQTGPLPSEQAGPLPAETDCQHDRDPDSNVGIEVNPPADISTAASVPEAKDEDKPVSRDDPKEKKRRRIYRWKIIYGLCGPFTLQALDATIIASAFPYIATDFGEY